MSEEKKGKALEWLVAAGLVLIAVFLIRTFLFTVIRVEGDSMLGTLRNGDRLIVTIPDLKIFGPERGDVVICRFPRSRALYVKRVVALGGDQVALRAGRLLVNGRRVKEPYVSRPSGYYGPALVPEGTVFLLGDNRAESLDSRLPSVGPIAQDQLIGRVRGALHT